jgi:hypothetical protein
LAASFINTSLEIVLRAHLENLPTSLEVQLVLLVHPSTPRIVGSQLVGAIANRDIARLETGKRYHLAQKHAVAALLSRTG